MGVYIRGMEMPTTCGKCRIKNAIECDRWKLVRSVVLDRHRDCPLMPVPAHGRLVDADAARKTIKPWSPEDERSGCTFDTVKKLMYTMLDRAPTIIPASNDAAVILTPQIVHCCECEFNNHCLTQAFVEDESKIPFDKNTWFCADAQADPTIIPRKGG